jgi:ribosomal protein L20A (L18A)
MKLYRVSFNDGDNKEVAKWVGSQDEATKQRMAFTSEHGVKRKDISVENIDVPTSKAELIEWLNTKEV